MDEQPARALRDIAPHQQHENAENGPDSECEPPPDVGREVRRVQQDQRAARAGGRTQPIGSVDHQIDTPAHPRRDQLVDSRIDGGVFTADTRAGEETGQEEIPRGERERGRDGGDQIDCERKDEQVSPAEAVGKVTEEQRPRTRSGDVDRRRHADLRGVQRDAAVVLHEPGRHVAHHRDLEPVEHPHPAQADDDAPVKARPRQPVQPRRHMRRNGLGLRARTHAGSVLV